MHIYAVGHDLYIKRLCHWTRICLSPNIKKFFIAWGLSIEEKTKAYRGNETTVGGLGDSKLIFKMCLRN